MKLIAEGNFNDGFGAVSNIKFFEGETSNKIVETYRGAVDEYEVVRSNKGHVGEFFIYPFYENNTLYHCRYSEMLQRIRKHGTKC